MTTVTDGRPWSATVDESAWVLSRLDANRPQTATSPGYATWV